MDSTRLDIRLKPDTKDLIRHAAELKNQSVTQFAVTALSEAAGKVVAEHEQCILSDRDRDLFLELLDAPPKPNKSLKTAVRRYNKRAAG